MLALVQKIDGAILHFRELLDALALAGELLRVYPLLDLASWPRPRPAGPVRQLADQNFKIIHKPVQALNSFDKPELVAPGKL